MADILKFTDNPIMDESIEEYEYHEYESITGTSHNNVGDIRISIESQQLQLKPTIMDLLQGMHISSSHQPSKIHFF